MSPALRVAAVSAPLLVATAAVAASLLVPESTPTGARWMLLAAPPLAAATGVVMCTRSDPRSRSETRVVVALLAIHVAVLVAALPGAWALIVVTSGP